MFRNGFLPYRVKAMPEVVGILNELRGVFARHFGGDGFAEFFQCRPPFLRRAPSVQSHHFAQRQDFKGGFRRPVYHAFALRRIVIQPRYARLCRAGFFDAVAHRQCAQGRVAGDHGNARGCRHLRQAGDRAAPHFLPDIQVFRAVVGNAAIDICDFVKGSIALVFVNFDIRLNAGAPFFG